MPFKNEHHFLEGKKSSIAIQMKIMDVKTLEDV